MRLQAKRGSMWQYQTKFDKVREIVDYILSEDNRGAFASALRFTDNFVRHIEKVVEANQYIELRNGAGNLEGVCTYVLLDKERMESISKLRWIYPDNIYEGDILYITGCVLTTGRMFKIKKALEERGFRDKEVVWLNFARKRQYRRGKMNCGIQAFSNIKEAKKVSAFTLIHLARDNGVELNLYKVEPKDLPLVPRPAILHAKDHFVYVENGKALDDLEYTGYVLGEKVIGKKLSLQEAKMVNGGAPIAIAITFIAKAAVTVAAVAVNAIAAGVTAVGLTSAGAAIGGLGGALAGTAGAITVGSLGSMLTAGSGFLTGYAATHGTMMAAAGATIGAGIGATTGETQGWAGALKGASYGALAGTGLSAGGAFLTGFNAAPSLAAGGPAPSLGQKLKGGFDYMTSGKMPTYSGAGDTRAAMSMAGGGTGNVSGYGISGAAGEPAMSLASGGVGNVSGGAVGGARYSGALAGAENVGRTAFNLKDIGLAETARQGIGASNLMGNLKNAAGKYVVNDIATSMFGPEDPAAKFPNEWDPVKEYSALRGTIGDQALPPATERQLLEWVNTPLDQLTEQMMLGTDKGTAAIKDSFSKRRTALQRRFGGMGQSESTSSEFRDEMARLEKDEAQVVSEFQEDVRNQTVSQAIQTKQYALSNAFSQNQYDDNLAMELAGLVGRDKELEAAVLQQDANNFAKIMSEILSMGFGGGGSSLF